MAHISPTELHERLTEDAENVVVVDIRPEESFAQWQIPNSVNIPIYHTVADQPEQASEELSGLPTDALIVTVCAAGVRSQVATELLEEMGFTAKTLLDGMAGWARLHDAHALDLDIPGTLVQVARPGTGCLSHVLISDGEAAVFDPSLYAEEYEDIVDEYDADLVGVFDTHAHADHRSGGRALADRNAVPYYLHPADANGVTARPICDEDIVTVGAVDIEVIHTPGHSPGGVTFDVAGAAFLTGDTLFHESVGRVELGVSAGIEDSDVETNAERLYESIHRLRRREGNPLVLPAHDPGTPIPPVAVPFETVERSNPDLQLDRDTFLDTLLEDVPDHPANFERLKAANTGIESLPADEAIELEGGPNRCAAH